MKLGLPRGVFMTAEGEVFEARRVVSSGRSLVVTLPKPWAEFFVDGDWIGVEIQADEVIFRPLTRCPMLVTRT